MARDALVPRAGARTEAGEGFTSVLVLAFIAGALTMLPPPCVLPMVPLALMGGMSLAFTMPGTFLASVGPAIGLSIEAIGIGGR